MPAGKRPPEDTRWWSSRGTAPRGSAAAGGHRRVTRKTTGDLATRRGARERAERMTVLRYGHLRSAPVDVGCSVVGLHVPDLGASSMASFLSRRAAASEVPTSESRKVTDDRVLRRPAEDSATGSRLGARSIHYQLLLSPSACIRHCALMILLAGSPARAPSESPESYCDRTQHDHFPGKTIDTGDFLLRTAQAGICVCSHTVDSTIGRCSICTR